MLIKYGYLKTKARDIEKNRHGLGYGGGKVRQPGLIAEFQCLHIQRVPMKLNQDKNADSQINKIPHIALGDGGYKGGKHPKTHGSRAGSQIPNKSMMEYHRVDAL